MAFKEVESALLTKEERRRAEARKRERRTLMAKGVVIGLAVLTASLAAYLTVVD